MTSPPPIEPSACQTPILVPGGAFQTDTSRVTPWGMPVLGSNVQVLMVSLTNRTEPSTNATLIPPGWKLDAPFTKAPAKSMTVLLEVFFWGLIGQKWA